MKTSIVLMDAFIILLLLAFICCFAADINKGEKGQGDNTKNDVKKDQIPEEKTENRTEAAVVEAKVGVAEGKVSSKGLPLNIEIAFDEKSFQKEGSLSVHAVNKDIGLASYETLTPVWAVKCDAKFTKKVTYNFQFDKSTCKIDSKIVVLTLWGNNWVLSGIPQVSFDNGTVSIKADYAGWFAVVRLKSREEIKIKKYTFPDGAKKRLAIVGCFNYETKYSSGEDLLEEKLHFTENFSGDITFGPIERKKRTGITIFYAGAVGSPRIEYFQAKATSGKTKETVFATETKIPEQRGVISGQLKENKLQFDGMPTVITLLGLYKEKKTPLPTVRGSMNLSGIIFDWKLQEMFHLRNFIYNTELVMPHRTGEEETRLVVYLQFIVK